MSQVEKYLARETRYSGASVKLEVDELRGTTMTTRPEPRHTLARNLRFLMDRYGYSEAEVARRASVSQKTVNNMLNMRSGAKLDMVDQIATVFGLNLWHMIMPTLPDEYTRLADLDTLMNNWHSAGEQGKTMIQMVADREAAYTKKPANGE